MLRMYSSNGKSIALKCESTAVLDQLADTEDGKGCIHNDAGRISDTGDSARLHTSPKLKSEHR
jgi:hypothetical protein